MAFSGGHVSGVRVRTRHEEQGKDAASQSHSVRPEDQRGIVLMQVGIPARPQGANDAVVVPIAHGIE